MKAVYFPSPAAFRAWLQRHHAKETELVVGFHKKATGKPTLTWPESVDEALCFGWIDGVRHRVDDDRYTIRFTPRRPTSRWSAVNLRRMKVLADEGRLKPAGRRAFEARKQTDAGYTYERKTAELDATHAKILKANPKASAFHASLPPGYRRVIAHYVMSAKSAEVRLRRLKKAIAAFEAGKRL